MSMIFFSALQAGDLVDFRLIQLVAVGIESIATAAATAGASTSQPLLSGLADRRTRLKAELLEALSSRRCRERCCSSSLISR